MFTGQNLELVSFKKLPFNERGDRYEYTFHCRQQRKYLKMIGNANVPNFQEDMLVNAEFSLQQDGYRFAIFITNIIPIN